MIGGESCIKMTQVITAIEDINVDGFTVFLAGAIDMGSAIDWQSLVIDQLSGKDNLVLINPRRANWTVINAVRPETLDEQIHWELNALEQVDAVFMWFPKDAAAPISFLETGLYLRSDKIIIGSEMGFYRRRNLEITCERYGVHLWDSLAGMFLGLRHFRFPGAK